MSIMRGLSRRLPNQSNREILRTTFHKTSLAGSDDCGQGFRLKADSDSDRCRTAFR
jgi:hypothetical protein